MIKTILAAGAMAATLAMSGGAAEAKTHVTIGIGIGGYPCYNHYNPVFCGGYPPPPYYDPPPFYDPPPVYHNPPPYYDPPPGYGYGYGYGVSCGQAARMLRSRGYYSVRVNSCGGRYHTFVAYRGGGQFVVRVRSSNGHIRSITRVFY
jgi:hypothetical protein